jgi:DNA-binding NarL/FixJ family response regulator
VNKSDVCVLVVEDYAAWSDFICSMLRQRQELRVVCEASNGLDAMEKVKQMKADLILLDIGLPQLNGIEVARRILARTPQTKIIFISDYRDPEIVQEALNIGARGYVLKSQTANELLQAIEVVLADGKFVSDHLAPAYC